MVMYQKWVSSQFKTDLKVYTNKPVIIQVLERTINILAEWKTLPIGNKDHWLKGEFTWVRECHVFPDVLLIYEIDKKRNILHLVRVGSHSELFW